MYTNSGLLQAVISCRGNGKFYRLPPDKENPDHCASTKTSYCEIILVYIILKLTYKKGYSDKQLYNLRSTSSWQYSPYHFSVAFLCTYKYFLHLLRQTPVRYSEKINITHTKYLLCGEQMSVFWYRKVLMNVDLSYL
jgi:hypothetical protein